MASSAIAELDRSSRVACSDLLAILLIWNLINLNVSQQVILLENLAHFRSNGANIPLVKAAQMESAGEMVNLINGDLALISQVPINILAEILKLRNQALNR